MPRAKKGAARRQAKVRWFKAAKGYRGSRSKNWRRVREAVTRAGVYAYRDRRQRKRDFRALWITRITAACRARGIRYSQFIAGLKAAEITLNRKMLSEIAIADPSGYDQIVELATKALEQKAAKQAA
ncbi:MAG: 50S ribosomal protein L20 [Phycisphaera sp.]|nr:50S ribosomal protein L20 [Phycisphaera sp.]